VARPRHRLYLFADHIVQLVSGVAVDAHRHGVLQLSVSVDGKPHRCGDDEVLSGRAILVGSNHPHVLFSDGGVQAVYWISPESRLGAQLANAYLQEAKVAALPEDLVDDDICADMLRAFQEKWPAERYTPVNDALFDGLMGKLPRSPQAVHPAIKKAVRVILGLEIKRISAKELGDQVGLSESRLMHLFKEHMHTPLRAYLAWMRLLDATFAMFDRDKSITEIAHATGFSDAAHLNRVMNQYFAVNPSAALEVVDFEVVDAVVAPD
jgi:AraC-like DNA-binding protein